MNAKLEKALYEAFLEAAKSLGPQVKGMSCFVRNWPAHLPTTNFDKKAA